MGVIGCGGVAHGAHLPNIIRNPRARLVAVADIDLDRAWSTAEQYGGTAYQDYQELLANPEVEAVCVTTWAAAHAEPVIAAAQAGKHILCEKPIAIRLEDADAMVEAADRAGVKFTMGYQHRFGAATPLVKQILDAGLIGNVMGLNIAGVGPSSHGAPWFLKRELSGGGVLMDWGIYTAFSLNWWLGPVERVYATSAIFRKEVMVRGELLTDLDVEDTVAAHLTFRSGAMGSWYSTWAVKAGHSTTSSTARKGRSRSARATA
jgi:predicted dehydrogenase